VNAGSPRQGVIPEGSEALARQVQRTFA
jgi:hypothetical protein